MDYAAKCQLISLVEEEECIWNTSIEDYARLDKKNASWNRIHAEMAQNGYTGGLLELKTQWKNLRDQWRKNSMTKPSVNCRPWTFEKHLLFLATAQNEADRKESAVKRWLTSVFGDPKEEEARNAAMKIRMDVAMKRELIKLVKEEEMLWNTDCRDYYRPDKKNLAWSRILTRLQRKGFRGGMLELKASWKTLRDSKRRNSIQPNLSGKPWMYEKDMEFMDGPGNSMQFSPHESDSKNGIVDSPRSSATPENEGTAEEAASGAASEEANDDFFVPTEVSQEATEECSEPSRKRSYAGGTVSKKKKNDSLQEGLDMIREITASLRERLAAASMDKYDRYGAFIASSLREMSEPAAKRKMAELMDILLNNR